MYGRSMRVPVVGAGENPRIAVAAKSDTAIEKGFAAPGLLAYIVTSKFSCRNSGN